MPKQVWTVAAILTGLLILGVLGLAHWQRGLELAEVKARAAAAEAMATQQRAAAETNQTRVAELQASLAQAQTGLEEVRREAEQSRQNQQSIEAEFRRALESKDITISELQGKLTVDILDRILFDSGEAQLKLEGQEVLRKVAGVLAQYPNRRVHVIGHTDNVPIRAGARSRFPSNWELSTARAVSAVRFLTEQAGVDARQLGAVGYGEFRPLADNATPEGRAKNRRIALVVLSDELVGADVPGVVPPGAALPAVPGHPVTNAVPIPASVPVATPPVAPPGNP